MIMIKLLLFIFPWKIRRLLLNRMFHYKIHETAKIGLAWVFPKTLIMHKGSRIGHFTVVIHLDKVEIGENSTIGRSNWITGFPAATDSRHFSHQPDRKPELIMGNDSAITKKHHIDCTNSIFIGNFVTIAGYHSQLLTHSVDITANRQDSHPITIGDYTFIGTNVVILGGSKLPSYSVLGAKSLLNKAFTEEWKVYAGSPAAAVKDIPAEAGYFQRKTGFVE